MVNTSFKSALLSLTKTLISKIELKFKGTFLSLVGFHFLLATLRVINKILLRPFEIMQVRVDSGNENVGDCLSETALLTGKNSQFYRVKSVLLSGKVSEVSY